MRTATTTTATLLLPLLALLGMGSSRAGEATEYTSILADPHMATLSVPNGAALPPCFRVRAPSPLAATYCVEARGGRDPHGWTTYDVEPAPAVPGWFTVALVATPSPLIFAEDFEDGVASLSNWSAVRGGVGDGTLPDGDPHVIRGLHWYPVGHLHSAAGNDYLVSTVMGHSVSTDTPASTPYQPYLEPGQVVDWSVYDTSAGWLDVGGVVKHREVVFTARNERDEDTHIGPLDGLLGETFDGEEFLLYAVDPVNRANGIGLTYGEIADGQVLFRGTVIDASFSGELQDQFTWTVREQTAEGLSVPTSPFTLYGAGAGVKVEDGGSYGAGARIVRADDANMRGTGSQWFAWAFAQFGSDKPIPVPASEYTIWESPICRLLKDPSAFSAYGGVKVQLLDSASSWTTVVAAQEITKDYFKTLLVNYDSAATSAELFVNGVSVGSTTISGGIKAAAASGTAEWYASPDKGVGGWTHYWFRHGTRKLAASEVADRGLYAFDFADEANLTAAIEFVEATGTTASDYAALANGTGTPAVLTSFADANGAWQESALGNLSQARVLPPVIIGRPFMAKMMSVGIASGIYSAGYAGDAANTQRVVADGVRLKKTPSATSYSATFRTTGKEIDGVPMVFEPAIGQVLTWTGDSDPTNNGNYTITKILIDPRTYNPVDVDTATIAVAETFTAGTIAGVWTSVDTPDWAQYGNVADAILLSPIRIDSGATDNLAQGIGSGGTEKLIQDALESFGPEVTPTLTNLASIGIKNYGWQGDGEQLALQTVDTLARVNPSADYSPTVVYRSAAAAWQARGMDAAPTVADFTLDERQIRAATRKALPTKYDRVRVRFARAWSEVPPGLVTSLNTDALPQEAAHKFREVTSGTGSRELVVEAFFLLRSNAQPFADALLSIITTGRLYKVDVYGPITKELAAAEPFDVFSITWSADSFLSAGRKGTLVGWSVDSTDNSATAIILFIP